MTGGVPATVLLATMGRQVYTQWRDCTSQGVSKWLFIGQLAASSGFVLYSWPLGNWMFVVTNALMLLTAGLGQWIYLGNKKGGGTSRYATTKRRRDRQWKLRVLQETFLSPAWMVRPVASTPIPAYYGVCRSIWVLV